ncbi:MAG: hypothetical protein HYZ29_20145 [Myxococcales bacterium]|nr:hypothetical protein [Myxococcales bacterium]
MSGALGVLMVIGLPLCFLLGGAALLWATPKWLRFRALGRPGPVSARAPGLVALAGTVRATAEGTFDCPWSGQPAVYARVAVLMGRMVGVRYPEPAWLPGLEACVSRPFLLEDEAGDRALVDPSSARVDLTIGHVPVAPRKVERTPEKVVPFLGEAVSPGRFAQFQARLAARTPRDMQLGFKYEEERIGPGDQIFVFGVASRPSSADPSADPEAPLLVVAAAPGQELMITSSDPATQRAMYGQAVAFGVVALSIGVGMAAWLFFQAL